MLTSTSTGIITFIDQRCNEYTGYYDVQHSQLGTSPKGNSTALSKRCKLIILYYLSPLFSRNPCQQIKSDLICSYLSLKHTKLAHLFFPVKQLQPNTHGDLCIEIARSRVVHCSTRSIVFLLHWRVVVIYGHSSIKTLNYTFVGCVLINPDHGLEATATHVVLQSCMAVVRSWYCLYLEAP